MHVYNKGKLCPSFGTEILSRSLPFGLSRSFNPRAGERARWRRGMNMRSLTVNKMEEDEHEKVKANKELILVVRFPVQRIKLKNPRIQMEGIQRESYFLFELSFTHWTLIQFLVYNH